MSASSSSANRWKWRALAAIPILLLSLGPQIHFWLERRSQWHGAFATHHADEFLYSGYVNTLADGRPRRNDPFTGRDDRLPETAFSIQVIPAFVLSSIARIISASTTFIVLAAAAGLLASLAIFWLLSSITGDHRLAAAGVLFVLLTGTIFAGQGLIGVLFKLDIVSLGLPFLRRYQPAAMFFLFFIFCAFIWKALTSDNVRRARLQAVAAGLSLGILVFSYFYLWTAALAWLVCLGLLWSWLRPAGQRRQGIEVFAIVSVMFALAIVPYAYLISNRARTLDELQTLISTHRPDLFRIPEIIGVLIVVILVVSVRRNKIQRSDPRVIFAGSFAVLPLVVFNQQVITGRSMQPFHFEAFIVNYVVLVGAVILAGLLWQNISRKTVLWIAAFCILFGVVEVEMQATAFSRTDTTKDEMIPVLKRLDQLPAQNGSAVFSPYLELNQILPTWTQHGTLLAIGSIDFGSASHAERKEFLYTHLYYSGATAERLRALFNGIPEELGLSYYVKYAVFGHERVRPLYALHFHPLTQDEIEAEVAAYARFVDSFSRQHALQHPLKYAIADDKFDFTRLDRWYERDAGERVGAYTLYQLKLRE
jgi:hypothetical protein